VLTLNYVNPYTFTSKYVAFLNFLAFLHICRICIPDKRSLVQNFWFTKCTERKWRAHLYSQFKEGLMTRNLHTMHTLSNRHPFWCPLWCWATWRSIIHRRTNSSQSGGQRKTHSTSHTLFLPCHSVSAQECALVADSLS
jgi:hypothetical protein